MSDSKNKTKTNESSVDQLVKLLYDDPINTGTKEHLISKDPPTKDNYEIYNFLEKEYRRLKALDQFLTQKLPIKVNYDQTERLIEHEQQQQMAIKNQLIEQLLPINSKFNQELKQIWEIAFKQK